MALQERDALKILGELSPNPILRSQRILPQNRSTHAGTRVIADTCKKLQGAEVDGKSFSPTALRLDIVYRCSGSHEPLLELSRSPPQQWRQLLSEWTGPVIQCTAYRPTAWPSSFGSGRRFFTEGLVLDLASSCEEIIREAIRQKKVYTMKGLAQEFSKFFEKPLRLKGGAKIKYSNMMFALSECVRDIATGCVGHAAASVVDPSSVVYRGNGCDKGLKQSTCRGASSDDKIANVILDLERVYPVWHASFMADLSASQRRIAAAAFVTSAPQPYMVEAWFCEFHKYRDIICFPTS